MTWNVSTGLLLFANDTNLTVSAETIEEVELAMNSDLVRTKEWLLADKLSLNAAKTEFMLISSELAQSVIKINQTNIKQVYNMRRVLGVEIDNKLKWYSHIRDLVDKQTLILVYNALIRPHFEYCSEVWNTLGTTFQTDFINSRIGLQGWCMV